MFSGIDRIKIENRKLQLLILYFSIFFTGSNLFMFMSPIVIKTLSMLGLFCVVILEKKKSISNITKIGKIEFFIVAFIITRIIIGICYFSESIIDLLSKSIIYLFILVFIYYKTNIEDLERLLKINLLTIYWVSFLAVIGTVINFIIKLPIFYYIDWEGRAYEWHFFYWNISGRDALISLGFGEFYRLQGIFDEPGSYAFIILPTLFYAIIKNQKYKAIILGIALLLTFSVGAISTFIVLYLIYLLKKRNKYAIIVTAIVVILLVIYSGVYIGAISEYIQLKFGTGKYAGVHSSYGVRQNEYLNSINILAKYPFGINPSKDMLNEFGFNISSGIVRELSLNGIIGIVFRIIIEIQLLLLCFKNLFKVESNKLTAFFVILPMLLMGYQRMTFLQTFYGFFIVVIALKYSRKEVNNG